MSSSSSRRHLKSSSSASSSRRTCDYGDNHVSRDRHEDLKAELRTARERVEEKDKELLTYHNDLAAREEELEQLREDLKKKSEELTKSKEEVEENIKDYNELLEDNEKVKDEFNASVDRIQDLLDQKKDLQGQIRSLGDELRKARQEEEGLRVATLKRERSPSPSQAAVKRLQTENQDLRNRFTQILQDQGRNVAGSTQTALTELEGILKTSQARVKTLEEETEKLRRGKIDSFFTPEPEDDALRRVNEVLPQSASSVSEALRVAAAQITDLKQDIGKLRADQQETLIEVNSLLEKPVTNPKTGVKAVARDFAKLAQEALRKEEANLLAQAANQREEGRLKYELDAWRNLAQEWSANSAEDFDEQLRRYVEQGDLRPWQDLLRKQKQAPGRTRSELVTQVTKLLEDRDLSAFRELHPSLEKLPRANAGLLAKALTEAITWELTSLWQYLPHAADEKLVTPSSRLGDLLERVKQAVIKQSQQPAQQQSKQSRKQDVTLVHDLNNAQARLREVGPLLDFLVRTLENLARNGKTTRDP